MTFSFPPREVTALLRVDGLVVFAATLVAYHLLGGNWWVFAALLLVPDLSMLGYLAGGRVGAWTYNLAHIHAVPVAIGGLAWLAGAEWLVPYMLIWVAHIAMDRAAGYGLKYADLPGQTHLGRIGRLKPRTAVADPR